MSDFGLRASHIRSAGALAVGGFAAMSSRRTQKAKRPVTLESPLMREVIPSKLWIGNALDARDIRGVLGCGIAVIIDLAIEEPPIQVPGTSCTAASH